MTAAAWEKFLVYTATQSRKISHTSNYPLPAYDLLAPISDAQNQQDYANLVKAGKFEYLPSNHKSPSPIFKHLTLFFIYMLHTSTVRSASWKNCLKQSGTYTDSEDVITTCNNDILHQIQKFPLQLKFYMFKITQMMCLFYGIGDRSNIAWFKIQFHDYLNQIFKFNQNKGEAIYKMFKNDPPFTTSELKDMKKKFMFRLIRSIKANIQIKRAKFELERVIQLFYVYCSYKQRQISSLKAKIVDLEKLVGSTQTGGSGDNNDLQKQIQEQKDTITKLAEDYNKWRLQNVA